VATQYLLLLLLLLRALLPLGIYQNVG